MIVFIFYRILFTLNFFIFKNVLMLLNMMALRATSFCTKMQFVCIDYHQVHRLFNQIFLLCHIFRCLWMSEMMIRIVTSSFPMFANVGKIIFQHVVYYVIKTSDGHWKNNISTCSLLCHQNFRWPWMSKIMMWQSLS